MEFIWQIYSKIQRELKWRRCRYQVIKHGFKMMESE